MAKHEKIIQEMREKKDEDILAEVLEEIKEGENVKSERPELNDVNTDTYNIAGETLALNYKLPIGSREKYSVVFLRIINLINSGYSPNIGIFGKSQRGKSETAIYILETLHNDLNILKGKFNPKQQVIYEVIPFLLFYRYNKRSGALFEEAGETLNKNTYRSKMNMAVAGTLRTQGKKQNVNIFVTPEASELDPRITDNLDIEIELTSTGKAEITFYERIHGKKAENRRRNYKFGKVNGKWNIPRASKKTRQEYDEIDSSYKGRYLDKMLVDTIEEKLEEMKEDQIVGF